MLLRLVKNRIFFISLIEIILNLFEFYNLVGKCSLLTETDLNIYYVYVMYINWDD